MKMALVHGNLYMGEGKSGSSSTFVGDEEVCAVCLEEMVEGRKWFARRVSINFMLDASGDGLRSVCCLGRKLFARRVSINMPLRL
ncbi:hypothetical protein KFK09_013453 [Dendrobium nobile]|uniref:Uncharacterized protein n=1 Tax=Dendrobium nobile TaxID=94219 RepID=A0A8T3B923_DENNO|nr:hypothetical protein KFK09_013453 [Dendrobium nobile]